MSDDFFSRWSHRKQLAAKDRLQDGAGEPEGLPVPDAAAASSEEPEAITAEELAALPEPESVTEPAALMDFLRKGVPAALRNRALRRMWSMDPAIRDYIGDARDYAWDWNVPGGVPVSGPLDAGTDVQKMVRSIFGNEDGPNLQKTASISVKERLEETEVEFCRSSAAIEISEHPNGSSSSRINEESSGPAEMEAGTSVRPRKHGSALPHNAGKF
jgi:hypothetical protein